ncbi:MAG: allantoate amidohydrolase [Beijerinckiaceae bacterium]|nr:allantoate amidohydrolase [Beijerinckiaceae bacterium]
MTRPNLPATTRMMERLDALALVTDEPGKITRLYLSDAHRRAIDLVSGWFREAGLAPAVDAAGNIHARFEGREPGLPALIIASHIDTVRDAGRYDGNLGVLAGLAVVEELARLNERLPFAVEVIAFGDEEGVRFPQTLTGSRAVAGRFDLSALDGRDRDGVSMREALTAFGLDPQAIASVARKPGTVIGYLELHIEQGPVLEAADEPLGIVTSIASIQRFTATVTGEAGHAGTVPMPYRKDALAAVAEMVLAVEREARIAPGLVGTVGRIEASPGAINVIPGSVTFTLDLRAPDDAARHALVARVRAAVEEIAGRRGVTLALEAGYEEQATPCHPAIQEALAKAIESLGHKPLRLLSGAGHDAMAFEALCPMGMLFLRCKGGISHNPLESITESDADVALAAMLAFVRTLDPAALAS